MLYEEIISKVGEGEKLKVNFGEKSFHLGKGKFSLASMNFSESLIDFTGDGFDIIEELYHSYKYSTPSEMSARKRRDYFKALSADEMSDAQLVCGENREVARAKLELFILFGTFENKLPWPDEKKWFWKGKDPDLILLKEWFK